MTGRREIKIGISKRPRKRRQSVDAGIKGRVILLCEYKVKQASKVERDLHNRFEDWHMPIRDAKKGAGGTEFYRLSNRQVRRAKRVLEMESASGNPIQQVILFMFYSFVALFLLTLLLPK